MTMNKSRTAGSKSGFTLLELLITVSILAILSSIAMVNLSSSWTSKRLLATTRDLENWLSEQRRFAITNNLTCRVIIDDSNQRLSSTVDSSSGSEQKNGDEPRNDNEPCIGNTLNPNAGIFDLASNFGKGHEKLSLISCPPKESDKSEGGIRFSFQGLSDNYQLESSKDYLLKSSNCKRINNNQPDQLQIMLAHQDLDQQRCIRIISPIGMIRDGRTQGTSSNCHYDKNY